MTRWYVGYFRLNSTADRVRQAAVYHDAIESNVYVSQDEGKSWAKASGIPEGKVSSVIEHPFDTRYVRGFVVLRFAV